MKRIAPAVSLCLAVGVFAPEHAPARAPNEASEKVRPAVLELVLQSRDPKTGQVRTATEKVPTSKIGVVVVDVWDYHWCSTWCGRAGAMIPRMNRALEAARKLGTTVVFSPTDCSSGHAGTPPREAMAALPYHPLPKPRDFNPDAPWSFGLGSGCMCGGPYECVVNYDNYCQDPRLVIAAGDFMSSGHHELHNLCQEKGLTHLIYMGGATNMCLCHKPEGMIGMTRLGYRSILARDITEAHGPNRGSADADAHTALSVAHIEKLIGPSVDFVDMLRKIGAWDEAWIVDSVLIAPWGFKNRPKFFDQSLGVSMSLPRVPGAEIRYTLDGSEPKPDSPRYEAPLTIHRTTTLRAVAFARGKKASLESEAYYVRMPPQPPIPAVYVSDLKPIKINMAVWSDFFDQGPLVPPPQMDKSYLKGDLKLRAKVYKKGIGVYAPAQLVYPLKPEYEAFVARAGVDESCLQVGTGRGRAEYSSVVFRVFLDGKMAAESPVMRITQEPWRFDVKIPPGSRVISLAVTDAGDGNREDYANWVDAGFVVR
jgi:nicotinamidase-related amidase